MRPRQRGHSKTSKAHVRFNTFYHGGAFALETALYWALRSGGPADIDVTAADLDRGYGKLPLIETDDRASRDVGFFNDWVGHPTRDSYWQAIDGERRWATTQSPVLLMAGWFDPFLPGELSDFVRVRSEAGPKAAENTRLTGMKQQDLTPRGGVLSFVTDPLDSDMEITGPIRAVLYVKTSAPSTDFTTLLMDVHPNGRAYNISEGILRRAYAPVGQPERIEISMWPTSIFIRKGHALRLHVSSSSYPRFDVNPNTLGPVATETEPVGADQTVFWGGDTDSHIVLPVIPW